MSDIPVFQAPLREFSVCESLPDGSESSRLCKNILELSNARRIN